MRLSIRNKWTIFASALIILLNSGCASLVAKTPPPVLLSDDKIYTVPAGQEISVELDHRPMKLTFPYPMKLMSIDRAIRDEQMKNDAMLKSVKASGQQRGLIAIIGSILGIAAGVIWIVAKKGLWPKISAKVDVK